MASFHQNNHCNVVSFSRTFYDKKDVFPLLYVSQCQRGRINGRKDVIYVERIANDLKSSELVQTIYFKDVHQLFGYALQWVVDTNLAYAVGKFLQGIGVKFPAGLVGVGLDHVDGDLADGGSAL